MTRALCVLLALALAACAAKPSARDAIADELEEMRAEASQHIQDPRRAAQVLESIEGLKGELFALEEAIANVKFGLRTLNAKPDATRADFDALLDGFEAERNAVRARILSRHFELIAATTEDEWKRLWPHERDALVASAR